MNRSIPMACILAGLALAIILSVTNASSQPALPTPEASQKAILSQTVGISEITVTYHRPGVKNRKVWGALVPYGEVWRAGANENTTISFSDAVKVEGKPLPAGTYGLHMIPRENEWTIIFSKNATSWGSYFYQESEDALRVTVKPQAADHQEWLGYGFDGLTDSSAVVSLRWEKLSIPFTVHVDTRSLVIANARNAYLRGLAGFSWQGWNQASAYCLRNKINLEEALQWADKSITLQSNFTNMRVKAGILEGLGKSAEAKTIKEQAISLATSEAELNVLGYEFLAGNNIKEAIEIFKSNAKLHPESWNVFDSLGEAYEKAGDGKLAIENYSTALKLVRDDENRKRIEGILKKLNAK